MFEFRLAAIYVEEIETGADNKSVSCRCWFFVDAFILLKELALLKLPTGTTDDNKSLNSKVKK